MRPFFFLPDDHMPKVNRQILELIYHTDGGFSWKELYSEMPIYIRQYMVRELDKIKKKEKEEIEKQKDGGSSGGGSPQGPPQDIAKAMKGMEDSSSQTTSSKGPPDAQDLGDVMDALQS